LILKGAVPKVNRQPFFLILEGCSKSA